MNSVTCMYSILYLGDNVTIKRRNWWRIKSRLCLKVQAWDGGRVMTMERSARCDKRWPHFLVVVLRMNPVYWYDWFYLTTWRNVSVIRKKIDGYGFGYCCVAHLGLATNHQELHFVGFTRPVTCICVKWVRKRVSFSLKKRAWNLSFPFLFLF